MAPPSGVLWADDKDISELGLGVIRLNGVHGSPRLRREFVQPWDVVGAIPSVSSQGEPRRIGLSLGLGDGVTRDTRQAAIDDITRWVQPGSSIRWRFGDSPTRYITAVCDYVGAEGLWGPELLWENPEMAIDLELLATDPYRYDLYPDLYPLSGSWKQVTVEAGAKEVVVEIYGNATPVVTPVLHIARGQSFEEYGSLTLTGASLGAGDTAEVRLSDQQIWLVEDDVRTSSLSLLALGSGGFPSLEGGREGYCHLRLTASSGTPTGRLYMRGAYR